MLGYQKELKQDEHKSLARRLNIWVATLCLFYTCAAHLLESLIHIVMLPFAWLCPPIWRGVRIFCLRFCMAPMFFSMWVGGIKLRVTGDGLPHIGKIGLNVWGDKGEKFILMSNHKAFLDTCFIALWTRFVGNGDGTAIWMIFQGFRYAPIGQAAWWAGATFVGGRDSESSMAKSFQTFAATRHRYVVFFPEGSVSLPEKLAKNQEWSRTHDLPVLHNCMLPRTGAFLAMMKHLPAQGVTAIYDLTIGYPKGTPWHDDPTNFYDISTLKNGKDVNVHFHCRRHDISEVGETEAEQTKWLYDRYGEKDKTLLPYFKQHDRFPGDQRDETPSLPILLLDQLVFWLAVYASGYVLWQVLWAVLMAIPPMWIALNASLSNTVSGLWSFMAPYVV
jgi:1-acyl-sn-glycerol-3-phosphate acyltransferase